MAQHPQNWVIVAAVVALAWSSELGGQNQAERALTNPVASTAESLSIGRKSYESNCAACHGNTAEGAVRAGTTLPAIGEQNGRQPPDLTDDRWDHGSTDGEIFTAIKMGLPPTLMPGFEGGIPDSDIWSVVNYLRSLKPKR